MARKKLENIMARLEAGVTVATVNGRLSRYLGEEYDLKMLEAGKASWVTPSIRPLCALLASLWSEAFPSRPLLTELRASALWEKIVRADIGEGLLAGAAQPSYQAYSILGEYRLKLPDEIYLTEEAKALRRWSRLYGKEAERLGFYDRAEIWANLPDAIRKGDIELPGSLILAGFDELSPGLEAIVRALEDKGVKVESWSDGEDGVEEAEVTVRPFEDETIEVVQAARWVRSIVRPGIRIGVIVPDMNRYRELIEKEFRAELDPASVRYGKERKDVFNISLGSALIEEPLVRSALDIVSINEGKEDMEKISSILLSPYFSGGGESLALAGLDAWLKEKNFLKASLYDLGEISKHRGELKAFSNRIEHWLKALKEARKKSPPSALAKHFGTLLRDIGWLKPVKLTSAEYQAHEAWNNLLESLSSLDDITGDMTRAEASAKLASLAASTLHQRKTRYSPVQVLGLLESTGQTFDHVWLMGCHEYALPTQPSPNPFIPLFLQRQVGIPHSTHEKELEFARASVARLLKSSPHLIVSYPKRADDKDLVISPLFKGVGDIDGSVASSSSRLKDAVRRSSVLEPLPEDEKIPVTDDELKYLRGGTSIIKNQSLCPFRAFAIHRLGAKAIAQGEPGLPSKERGTLLHKLMEAFWEKVEDSDRLKTLIERGELEAFIKKTVEEVFKDVRLSPPFSVRFIEIEKERHRALLRDWAVVESKRGRFKVKKTEIAREIVVAGLRITQRPDRIDSLEDGRLAIIDYKSGEADKADWLTERPKEPQLIIYCLYDKYHAVSFARLAPGECRFVGIAKDEGMLPGIKPFEGDKLREKAGVADWDGLMDFWKNTIEGLVKAFMEGKAEVDPNEGKGPQDSPCQRCELLVLCRHSEAEHKKNDE